ncbi:MAG: DNA repair and recombination protein RadA, partial [Candidatus Aenigmarchaeota archaeon]|nr:DNA repair and recombination protein RadA [Candidatus Aenigmarchaeota archaeon]
NTFRPERIQQMSEAMGMDTKKVLENIYIARAYNSDHQMILAEKAKDIMKEKNIKLIIVDSLMAHFRSDYVGRGTLSDRQQKLNRHMHELQKLGDTYNAAVYVTNQVMSKPNVLFGDPTEAIGGHIVGHTSTFRIYLRKSRQNLRVAKLVDSPHLPEGEAIFCVTSEGIKDQ